MHLMKPLTLLAAGGLAATSPGRSIVITDSRIGTNSTIRGGAAFTGVAWIDDVYRSENGTITTVMFEPGARTFWHRHEGGQTLRVLAGSGWISDEGKKPQRINVGDTVWCHANTTHWHGADEDSYLLHLAFSHGATEWLGEVTV